MKIQSIKANSNTKKFLFNAPQPEYIKKIASDIRNNAWLKEQHFLKEQEYNRIWNEAEQDLIAQIEKAKNINYSL